jgi:multidrug efflux pump subunit AcrB
MGNASSAQLPEKLNAAIVFTPALCATMLKPVEKGHHEKKRGFFGLFNRLFDASNRKYTSSVGYIVRSGGRNLAIYLAMVEPAPVEIAGGGFAGLSAARG